MQARADRCTTGRRRADAGAAVAAVPSRARIVTDRACRSSRCRSGQTRCRTATRSQAPNRTLPTPPSERDSTPAPNGTLARATVLLVLDSDDNAGAARVKPDPIICFDQQCWLSNGLEAPAKPMPRSEAVALKIDR